MSTSKAAIRYELSRYPGAGRDPSCGERLHLSVFSGRAPLDSAKHCLAHEFELLGFRTQMGASIRFAFMDDLAIG